MTINYNNPAFQAAKNNYFTDTAAGTTQNFDGVTLRKNDDGTATLITKGNAGPYGEQELNINANTDPSKIAQWAPGIKAAWEERWGKFTPPSTNQNNYSAPTHQPQEEGVNWQDKITSQPMPNNTMRNITPNETVAGQITGLLSEDSPYIQQFRNAGKMTAAGSGMLGSSLAAGWGEREAYKGAAPIAGQDASTYAAAGLSAQNANQDITSQRYKSMLGTIDKEQDLWNEISSQDNAGEIQQDQSKLVSGLNINEETAKSQLNMNEDQYRSYLNESEENNKHNLLMAEKEFDADFRLDELDAMDRTNFANAVSPIWSNYLTKIGDINMQPDSSFQKTGGGKLAAIEYETQQAKAAIASMASIYKYEIDWEEFFPTPENEPPEDKASEDEIAKKNEAEEIELGILGLKGLL